MKDQRKAEKLRGIAAVAGAIAITVIVIAILSASGYGPLAPKKAETGSSVDSTTAAPAPESENAPAETTGVIGDTGTVTVLPDTERPVTEIPATTGAVTTAEMSGEASVPVKESTTILPECSDQPEATATQVPVTAGTIPVTAETVRTETDIPEWSREISTAEPQPEDPTTAAAVTRSPEATTAVGTSPVNTKAPVVTTAPAVTVEVTTKLNSPETSAEPLVTYPLPEVTQGTDVQDVLTAPNGDLVYGKWRNVQGEIFFVVDLTGKIGSNFGDTCQWWGWVSGYNTLLWGTYARVSEDYVLFSPDNELPPTHGTGTADTSVYTIESGWWH